MSLGHWVSLSLFALTARCPTVISVDVHSISGALTFAAWANTAHIHLVHFERDFLDG